MSDAALVTDGEYAVAASASTVDPRWTYHYDNASHTWLASVFALNPGAAPPPPPAATRLAFTVQPSGTTAGSTIAPPVKVAAQDGAGNTDATFSGSISVALGTNPSAGTLSGTQTVTAVSGVATFSNLSIDKAGTGYTLMATATGLTGATSAAFNITAAPAAPSGIVLDQSNGMLNTVPSGTTRIIKGFNPTNPHLGDAIIATFLWLGSTNIIDSVTDHLTDAQFTPVGNKYHLVDYVTAGGVSMATYVATNVQGYPYPNDPNSGVVLAVRANLSQSVTEGGVILAADSGVGGGYPQPAPTHPSDFGAGTGAAADWQPDGAAQHHRLELAERLYGGGGWGSGPSDRDQQQRHVHGPGGREPQRGALRGGGELHGDQPEPADRYRNLWPDGERGVLRELLGDDREPDGDDQHHRLELAERLYGGGGWGAGSSDRDQQQRHVHGPGRGQPHGGPLGGALELHRERWHLADDQRPVGRHGQRHVQRELHHAARQPDGDHQHHRLEPPERLRSEER